MISALILLHWWPEGQGRQIHFDLFLYLLTLSYVCSIFHVQDKDLLKTFRMNISTNTHIHMHLYAKG